MKELYGLTKGELVVKCKKLQLENRILHGEIENMYEYICELEDTNRKEVMKDVLQNL